MGIKNIRRDEGCHISQFVPIRFVKTVEMIGQASEKQLNALT
jgi:hypothetical protein